jgi:DNA-binding transcriptional MerR regulator
MPYRERELEKLYFSITEVAEMLQVKPSLLRFWESEFKQLKPSKNLKGNRQYTQKDIETFQKIYNLVKIKGFTLSGARMALEGKQPAKNEAVPTSNNEEVIKILERMRKKLREALGIRE